MSLLSRIPWSEQKKIAAWTCCREAPGRSPSDWRVDDFGNLIYRSDHGKQTEYGWEVDHRNALAVGGSDSLNNVRALHWRKNRELGGHLGNLLNQSGGGLINQAPNALAGLIGPKK